MSFTLTIMHEICMVTLRHNMNNKDKIEFTKRGVLWSHTVCLKESCLRLFDVNQCMKDRSNWPGVTLKFALFNHVFHVRCKKKWSLVVYNLFFFFYHHCMRHISWKKSVEQCAALKYVFLGIAQNITARCERHFRGQRQDGRKSPNSCCVNTFINNEDCST